MAEGFVDNRRHLPDRVRLGRGLGVVPPLRLAAGALPPDPPWVPQAQAPGPPTPRSAGHASGAAAPGGGSRAGHGARARSGAYYTAAPARHPPAASAPLATGHYRLAPLGPVPPAGCV